VQLGLDTLVVTMPDGRSRRLALHGCTAVVADGCVAQRAGLRRFVRMLIISWDAGACERIVVVTPPERGAVAPNVVSVPEVGADAVFVDERVWDALADWLIGGGRLAACSIAELSRLASVATPVFAALIGEVAARRAVELASGGPLRGGHDPDTLLAPLVVAARTSPRAAEALVAALALAAGLKRRRRR
jgi:hypothetical protein